MPPNDISFAEARKRMENRASLMRSYVELPVQVQSAWRGYPLVTAALNQLEQGWFLDACLLSDATWTDDHVAACINTRTNAPFALPMEFKYQGEGEDEDDDGDPLVKIKKMISRIVEKNFTTMVPLTALRELFRWGLFVNLGVGENVWAWKPVSSDIATDAADILQGNALFVPTLKTWNPQTCYWRWDTRSFWLIHEGGQIELDPGNGRWVTYSPQGHNHGWLYGMIRQLAKLWLDRVFTYRDWARAEEKFSLGVMKAFVPANADPNDKQSFTAEVTDMPQEATVICYETEDGRKFDLEMVDTQQVGTGYEIFVKRAEDLNNNMEMLILGQNLSTNAGRGSKSSGGATGSRAWRLHDSVRKDYIKADVSTLTEMLKFQVIEPFVYMNWGWLAQQYGIDWHELVPEATWQVEPAEDKAQSATAMAQTAAALVDFKTAGAPVDQRAICEKLDVPVTAGDAPQDEPPAAGSPERPNTETMSFKPPPGLKPGGRAGMKYAGKVADATKVKIARLTARYRKEMLAIIKGPGTYGERKQKIAQLFRVTDPTELREFMKSALLNSHLAGKMAGRLDGKQGT